MECTEVLEQLSEYVHAEMRDELCRLIGEHLAHCKRCKFFLDVENHIITISVNTGPTEAPMRATAALMKALSVEYRGSRPGTSD